MKKFLIMILAGIFCFSALAFAGCDKAPEQTNNTLKYKEEKLVLTLDTEVFSATVEEITEVRAVINVFSSQSGVIMEKAKIKDFFNKLFKERACFNFAEIAQEQFKDKQILRSPVTVYFNDDKFEFSLDKDGNKAYYEDKASGVYYQADTGDLSALYDIYMRY